VGLSVFPRQAAVERAPADQPRREVGVAGADAQREADRILLTRYVPASVLVSADLEILQFRGDTGLYLAPSPGKASLNLLKMLREGLLVGVRGALHKARREETPVREEGLKVRSNGGSRYVDVHVIPVRGNSAEAGPYFLVLFEDVAAAGKGRHGPEVSDRRKAGVADPTSRTEREAAERETARLMQELAATREYLQSVIEQQESANEELQSSNEEVQSANEELQSINEELETSKEEIESSNEELATVNEELQNRNLELSRSNNDFVNLLASAHLAIVMLGPDLRIRKFTPLAEKMFNLIAADVGRPITDIQLGVGVPNLTQLMIEVIDTVTVKELEVRDKEGRWHILRLRPYRTLDNKIDGVVVVLIDVDALKRDQDIRRRQSELLEQTEEPIFMWELGGGITYWNRGAEEVYGFTKAQAMGRPSHELLATSPPAHVYMDALKGEGRWTGELTHVRSDGERLVVESRMVRERSEDRTALVFQTDHVITERKRMEETLRQRAEELVVADQNKNEFLAMLAHELRNPLAPLSNALEIMRQPAAPPAMFDGARETMGHQIHNMSRLVDDLLDVSRMTQGRIALRKEPVDLLTIIEQSVETSRHHLEARGQTLTLSLPTEAIYVEADVLRLEQILGNLLNNASKFTAEGGQIWLTVERRPAAPNDVVIRVRDTGVGIAPEQLSGVFNLFMQADPSATRATGGLGIGLTLVRHLVELHGGSVEAHSPGLGRGSEFVVRLPALRERPRGPVRAGRRESPDPEAVPRRVLVTDDHVDGAETMAIMLRGAGHEVLVAHSGADALEIARDFRPQVIFLDVGMPGMDGYDTARQLRAMGGLEDTLLVALTGYGQESDRQHACEAGFDEFLVKPAIPEVVVTLASQTRSRDTAPGQSAADS
jgi:two-component system CheB/CheR fusion protein